MKEIYYALLIVMVLLTGCGKYEVPISNKKAQLSDTADKRDEVIEIKEKMFITQCNDVYLNPDDYKNKKIKLEGIYYEYIDEETLETYCYVIRYGPGCCGNDQMAGFEILFDVDAPQPNDWIEVIGTVEIKEDNGNEYVVLRVSELSLLKVRGAETVSN